MEAIKNDLRILTGQYSSEQISEARDWYNNNFTLMGQALSAPTTMEKVKRGALVALAYVVSGGALAKSDYKYHRSVKQAVEILDRKRDAMRAKVKCRAIAVAATTAVTVVSFVTASMTGMFSQTAEAGNETLTLPMPEQLAIGM